MRRRSPRFVRGFVLALIVVLAACGGGGGGGDGEAPKAKLPKVRRTDLTLRGVTLEDGSTRDYSLYEPDGTPSAAIIVLDSYAPSLPENQHPRSLFVEVAKERGYLVALPQGTNDAWNVGRCCGTAALEAAADLEYITAIADDLAKQFRMPAEKTHLVGWALGGIMAYDIACRRPDLVTSVAVVSGVLLTKPCAPSMAVDLLQIHQRGDELLPFGGAQTSIILAEGSLPSVPRSFARWRDAQDCSAPAVESDGAIESSTSICRQSSVARLVVIDAGSSDWPRGGDGSVDATAETLAFFGLGASGEGET